MPITPDPKASRYFVIGRRISEGDPLRVLVCFPFLDLRFLLRPDVSPMKPRWPYGGFDHVGELGPVLALADGSGEAEIRANAALLFPQEYQQERRTRRRWRPAPILESGVKVAGRRLLADDDGHVRVEITLSVPDEKAKAENVHALLDEILATSVDIVRIGRTDLIDAGFLLAQSYLRNSAKTAEKSQFELLDTLLREGAGSPFLVLVSTPTADDPEFPAGVPLDPPHPCFASSAYSHSNLKGHALGVWQLRGSGKMRSLLPHLRALCRIAGYQNEVSTFWSLQNDAGAVAPYLLDPARTAYFLRRRGGQLRQKMHSGWGVSSVQARTAHQISASTEERSTFRARQEALHRIVPRDVANDIAATLARIARDRSATREIPREAGNLVFVYVAGDAGNVTTVGGKAGSEVTEGAKIVSTPPGPLHEQHQQEDSMTNGNTINMKVGRDVKGNVANNTGSVTGDLTAGDKKVQTVNNGDLTEGDKNVQTQQNIRSALAPVAQVIAAAPPETREQAAQQLAKIEQELVKIKEENDSNKDEQDKNNEEQAKNDKADDTLLARLVGGLVDLVPHAASAVAAAFGGPILSALALPFTRFVIEGIEEKFGPNSG